MPHEVPIAIVEKSIEELAPRLVAAQERQPRHELQPGERERHVRVGDIPVRNHVAKDEMRLRDHRRSIQLVELLPG